MTYHPREGRLSRRDFVVKSSAVAFLGSGVGGLLAACGDKSGVAPEGGAGTGAGDTVPTGPGGIPLARKDHPVTLPLYDDNPMIKAGLAPEKGTTLKIYNWNEYIYTKVLKTFGKKYDVKVELTTFSSMDEAVAKLAAGSVDFDVTIGVVPDVHARMVAGKLAQPLNLDYIPNLEKNVWPSLVNPFYDQGSRYTVPYVLYQTGIAWRTDHLKVDVSTMDNPYDSFWESTYAKGKVSLFNELREALGMALLRRGETDVNTEDPAKIERAKNDIIELIDLVNIKTDNEDYQTIPSGQSWLHQAWSGDIFYAPYYLPKGVKADVIGYWWPKDGGGVIANDTFMINRNAKNPVLAHHFLNFMLDEAIAIENFVGYVGYQPPINGVDPAKLVADRVVPKNLETTIVRPEDFDTGVILLPLTTSGQGLWTQAWSEFKAGRS